MPGIHAHELLEVIEQSGGQQDRSVLRETAAEKFGNGTVFENCSGRRFTFDELIEFFQAKGRVFVKGDLIVLNQGDEGRCEH